MKFQLYSHSPETFATKQNLTLHENARSKEIEMKSDTFYCVKYDVTRSVCVSLRGIEKLIKYELQRLNWKKGRIIGGF